ncbi:MAG: SDR family NAD(P)-dependent oxidoreductase [Planctomycetota bacterium]|jgi:UDP-glucose 4-epimerase
MAYQGPVLVTGAAGFIGSHLCDALLAQGADVVAVDRITASDAENLRQASANANFRFLQGDLSETAFVESCTDGVSHVAHLAAMASVPASIKDPQGCHADTLTSTLNLLTAVRDEAASFVFASSAAVYGDTDELPVTESARTNPQSPYAAAKLAGEKYIEAFAHGGLNALALRFFNVYGARQNPASPYSGVISIFADRLQNGQPITIYGDGHQTRDFIYVSDVVSCIQLALQSKNAIGRHLNIGGGEETSLLTLLEALQQVTGKTAEVSHKLARGGDIVRSVADVASAKDVLGFEATTALKDGLHNMLGL